MFNGLVPGRGVKTDFVIWCSIENKVTGFGRAGTGSNFSGVELFRISNFGPQLGLGSWEKWLKPNEPLEILRAFLKPSMSYSFLLLSKSSGAWPRFGPRLYRVLGFFTASFSSGPVL